MCNDVSVCFIVVFGANIILTAIDRYLISISFQHYYLLLQIFEGSWDSNTPVTHYFNAAVVAQYVRILPQTWNEAIAVRFELLGCKRK